MHSALDLLNLKRLDSKASLHTSNFTLTLHLVLSTKIVSSTKKNIHQETSSWYLNVYNKFIHNQRKEIWT